MNDYWSCSDCGDQVPIEHNAVIMPSGITANGDIAELRFICVPCYSKLVP